MNIMDMSVQDIWTELEKRAKDQGEGLFIGLEGTAKFIINNDVPMVFILKLADDKACLIEEEINEIDCIFEMNETNFKKLLEGTLNATTAFMTGRLKVKGNMQMALKLERMLKELLDS